MFKETSRCHYGTQHLTQQKDIQQNTEQSLQSLVLLALPKLPPESYLCGGAMRKPGQHPLRGAGSALNLSQPYTRASRPCSATPVVWTPTCLPLDMNVWRRAADHFNALRGLTLLRIRVNHTKIVPQDTLDGQCTHCFCHTHHR